MKIETRLPVILVLLLGSWVSHANADSLRTVAFTGDTAPGTNAGFSDFGFPTINEAGQIAFTGALTGDGSNGKGIWPEGSGTLALVARQGSLAPGTEATFSSLGILSLSDSGHTGFRAFLAGSTVDDSNSSGIWSNKSGPLALVAREGSPAPGTNTKFGTIGFPTFNGSGQAAFAAGLISPVAEEQFYSGVWSEANGSLTLVASSDSVAPGTGTTIGFLPSVPVINNAGQTSFVARAFDSDNNRREGILSAKNGTLDWVNREGNAATGTVLQFDSLHDTSPVINSAGHTIFLASDAIWSEGSGTLTTVARTGAPAPGTNAVFSRFHTPTSPEPVMNGTGQAAFLGSLAGQGVDGTNSIGIWAQDNSGALTLIAREGDLLDVDDGPANDFRTIKDLGFGSYQSTGNEDGRPSSFNDLGQLVFHANFTDGSSGIFVSNLVAVPEPSSLALLTLAALAMLRRNVRS